MIFLRQLAGVFIIFLGIIGLVLPILQGWALIFLGLYLVAPRLALHLKRRAMSKFSRQELVYFEEWRKSGAHAALTTRHCPIFLSKTEDLRSPEKQAAFRTWLFNNKIALAHGMTASGEFVFLNQVHGDHVAVLDSMPEFKNGAFHEISSADAVVTNQRGIHLLAMTADCLSIYFKSGAWIGLVHAGWRGTKAGIGVKTALILSQKTGMAPDQIEVIFGPAIGKKVYDVGGEFRDYFPHSVTRKGDRYYFDLFGENKRQLREFGILQKNIVESAVCPFTDARNYYSFRREKDKAGRMVSVLKLPYS